ncbi:MAG TPA: two-component regulator propeller domain-containing protein [Flavisolibacter sp.]|nr:two-component regulator propeller domain-containing protein [Flavisolibacter sp.]
MKSLVIFLLLSVSAAAQNTFPAIGLWREHLPYQGAIDITASNSKIYAATPYSLFSVDIETKEIERFSTVSGLSETGVSAISYDAISKKLFVAYNNSNVDVLDLKGINNIPDIKRSTIAGDKNIYAIYPDGERCYLSTGIGIIVLDAAKYEVKDSWFIGAGGGYVKSNGFTKTTTFLYAATEEGLKRTAVTTANPADFRAWQNLSGSNGLAASPAKGVVFFQNKIIALQNDSLFVENSGTWNLFFANGWPVVSMNVSGGKLVITQRQTSGASQVIVLGETGLVQRTIQQPGIISFPKKGIAVGTDYWIADLFGGLSQATLTGIESYKLNSPQDIVLGEMAVRNNILWTTGGSVNSSWNYQYNRSGIFSLEDGTWSAFNQYNHPQLDTLLDFLTIAIDPRDNTAWAGSFGGGLLHISNSNQLKIFKQNSPIGPTVGDPGSYRVAGLAFDKEANLWVANFGSTRQLHVLKADNTWQSFTAPFFLSENAAAQIVIDDAGQKWIQSPLGNGVIVFNEGSLANPADDKWKIYRAGTGLGGLPSNEVHCLAKDKSGFIWIGTSDGIAVVQCPREAFTTTCDAILPVIKEGSFANFLFKGQEVRSIAVDGADRKWVATSSGVWLISKDGDGVLSNYTEQNSPLPSNDAKRIAIDGSTGEVFIATAKGLISYRGTATEYEETKTSVLVYPNPVPPAFAGMIGIKGLPENSIVKITESNGRLVYQTRSLGGQAVWNGRDYKGTKAATGVYLVLAIDEAKGEKVVARIVMVSN